MQQAYDARARSYAKGGLRRLIQASIAMFTVLGVSSTGYYLLGFLHHVGVLAPRLPRPWTVFECLYMTVITISTIGYGETLPIPAGMSLDDFIWVRSYTIVVILLAMLLVGFAVSSATAFLIEGNLIRFWQTRRAMKDASRMSGHYILCGVGVTGTVILDELIATQHDVVCIDMDEERLDRITSGDRGGGRVITLVGDATTDELLLAAGIDRAQGLAAALPSDKDNVFLIVTARRLRKGALRIVALASSQDVRDKLAAVGADAVVSSAYIGGLRLASELFRPAVVTFLDNMLRGRERAVRFGQVTVGEGWAGRTVQELDLEGRVGLPLLALQRLGSNDFEYNPAPKTQLEAGMVIVTMGDSEKISRAEEIIGD